MAARFPLNEQLFGVRVLRLVEPEQRIVVAVEDGNEVGFGHGGSFGSFVGAAIYHTYLGKMREPRK